MEVVLEFSEVEDEVEVRFHLCSIGADYLLVVEGGDVPHIGSVTLGNQNEVLTQSLKGHKEYVITEAMFSSLKEVIPQSLSIVGGIHVDHISKDTIKSVEAMCHRGAQRIYSYIKGVTYDR